MNESLENGYYWMHFESGEPPEVVQIEDGHLLECGNDERAELKGGQWVVRGQMPIRASSRVWLTGPIHPPAPEEQITGRTAYVECGDRFFMAILFDDHRVTMPEDTQVIITKA